MIKFKIPIELIFILFALSGGFAYSYTPILGQNPVEGDEILLQWNKTENQYAQPNSLFDNSYSNAVKDFYQILTEYKANYKTELYSKYFMGTNRKLQNLITDVDILYTASLSINELSINKARLKVISDIAAWENLESVATTWINNYYFKIIIIFFIIFLFFVLSVILYANLLERSKDREQDSFDLNTKILQAQETERSRISRELHDTVAQDMKYSALLAEKIPVPELSTQILENQNKCIKEIRAMCYNLSPPDLDSGDFEGAIQMLCSTFKTMTQIEVRLSIAVDANLSQFNKDELLNLYRLVQECFNNIAQHAHASEVTVLFHNANNNNTLDIVITDDGCGMKANLVQQLNALSGKILTIEGHEHFGVRGMKERIRLLNGTLEFNSMEGEGTVVKISVPNKSNE